MRSPVLALVFTFVLAVPATAVPAGTAPAFVRPFPVTTAGRWEGVGLAYGPHRDGQRPGGPGPTRAQVREDLGKLAPLVHLLRVYGARGSGDTLLAAIRESGEPVRVMLGVWLAAEDRRDSTGRVLERFPAARAENRAELDAAVRLARAYPDVIAAIAVGNETQVFWSGNRVDPARLVEALREVRARTGVPVTTADDYNFWNKPASRAVARECDFLCVHLHPLWNGASVADAVPWVARQLAAIRALHPGREIVVGETGWATRRNDEGDQGKLMKGALGEAEQATVVAALAAWADSARVPTFVFEAFDENWKGGPDPADVEKHWGIFRADRTPKPAAAAFAKALAPAVPPAATGALHWRFLGPFRAGWATAAAGVPQLPHTYYFGAAGGGVWKSDDDGRTWRGLMQDAGATAIGALAVAPSDPRVIWAGTGQEGSRYDVAPGDGVYRSTDGGETWTHAGLADSRHIGAIWVDPRDPARALVAAIGHAFGPNAQRGVFLTTDGGRTWRGTLQPADSVGAVDLAADPAAPRTVYASTWQRRMHPWFDYFQNGDGPGSAIWRSDDGGEHWTRLAGGLPQGRMGRIGLAVARGSGGRIAYACIAGAGEAGSGLWRTNDRGAHWSRVNADANLASNYMGRLTVAPGDSNTVIAMGQSMRVSHDGGRTFAVWRGSPGGDDYHQLWIDPGDPARMLAASDQGAAVSVNGGRTWSSWYNQPTGQFYHVAADDRFPYHVYSGQQDNGTVEIASRGPYGVIEERDGHPVGGDEREPMIPKPGAPWIVFGSGLGGGVSRFDERTRQVAQVAPWPLGGYGARPSTVRWRFGWIAPLAISAAPPHALYTGAQVLFRSLDDGDHWDVVSPDLTGARPGAGPCDDPDPVAARECGFGVIACIAPSPRAADRVWVGTDDGYIRLTTDGGRHWRNVTPPDLPAWGIVFAIDASARDTATAYVAVDLHRTDRHAPLLYATHDSGRSWRRISDGLPGDEFTSVVRCDPGRDGLLYAGTNRSVYASFDDGARWQPLAAGLPVTWMRDLRVHQGDLLLATQGRGLWALDDVAPLRELAAGAARGDVHLFAPAPAVRLRGNESHDTPPPPETPLGENPPAGAVIDFWLARDASGPVTLTIADAAGRVVRRFSSADPPGPDGGTPYFERAWLGTSAALPATAGLHRFVWDLRHPRPVATGYHWTIAAVHGEGSPLEPQGPLVLPGRYTVTLAANGVARSQPLEVRLDPRVRVGDAALRAQLALALAADSLLGRAVGALRDVEAARKTVPPGSAAADSLAVLAARGDGGLAGLAGSLGRLVTVLQSADAAPAQGTVDALRAVRERIEGLLARWAVLQRNPR